MYKQCRICAENPLVAWFGLKDKPHPSTPNKTATTEDFRPRSAEDIRELIAGWKVYAHPRAKDFFETDKALEDVLMQLAKFVNQNDDPITGPEDKCVCWYGDVTKDDSQAGISLIKPGEQQSSVTYVNRLLAFIFATDDCFDELMSLPKLPFKMRCGNQLCVHLAHVLADCATP